MPKIPPQLCAKALQGDQTALAKIISQMMPTIRRGAMEAVCPGLDFEDAQQEGLIGLFGALQSYDPQGGASFPTYAAVCIRNAQWSARRAAVRKKHAPLNDSVPLTEQEYIPGPEEQLLEQEAYSSTMEQVNTLLSPLEKLVIGLRLDGLAPRQIAQRLNLPPKSVENALTRARRKLRQL